MIYIRLLAAITLALLLPIQAEARSLPSHGLDSSLTSPHFVYHFDDTSRPYVKQLMAFSEGFLSFIEKEYFTPDYDYPLTALVFNNKAGFQDYLKHRLGVANPPGFGIYVSKYRVFVTFMDSGLGTFAHEIMHPLVETNLPKRPIWAMEGIPAFFEKFIAYWDGKALRMQTGYQNPWRIHVLGNELTGLDLAEIVERRRNHYGRFRNSELRMVSVFLDRQGLLKRYIDLVRRGDRQGYATYLEAAFGKELTEIEPLWRRYLTETKKNRARIYRIPTSRIVATKKEFDALNKGMYLQAALNN